MTNLLILMLLYISYAVIAFWLFNGNFLSPSFVFSMSLSAMLCLAYYAANNMEMLFAIKLETFTIFATAGFIFLATEFLFYSLHTVNYLQNRPLKTLTDNPQPLLVNWQIQWAFTAFLFMSLILAVKVLYMNTGGGTWSDRMNVYKELMLHNPDKLKMRFIIAQLYKINIVTMDLFGYVMVYNLSLCKVPVKQCISYIIDVFLYVIFSAVSNGARQPAIEVLLFLMMIYVTLNIKPEKKKQIWRFLFKILPALIILASVFSVTGSFVGRDTTKKSGLQNLVEYVCGGLYSFNHRLDKAASSKIFGEQSFAYVYAIPQNMGLIPRSTENITFGEFDIYGNTITIFGRWYRDFGTAGVFVMTCLVSLFYSWFFYKKIIYSSNKLKEHHLARIYYCQFMTSLVWAGYDDRIATLMTMQTLVFFIMIAVLYKLLIVDKFKFF